MGWITDIFEKEEYFNSFDFGVLDRKIAYIQKYRSKEGYEKYDKTIKELNNRIDIDFIKHSESIEGNSLEELKDLDFDSEYEEIEESVFDKIVRKNTVDDFYLGKYRTIISNSKICIYRKDPETGKISRFKCETPDHLQSLKDAFEKARADKNMIDAGVKVDVPYNIVEKLHEKMFDNYIKYYVYQRSGKVYKSGSYPFLPEGYGKVRRLIKTKDGQELRLNLEVEGAVWQPTDCEFVESEIKELIDCYNNSKFHPIVKAAIFKACLIKIHPFRDGNGRVSRLLLNYMLIRYGIPTVTIRGTHKDAYYEAMDQAIVNCDYSLLIDMIKNELNQRCDQYVKLVRNMDWQNDKHKNDALQEINSFLYD